MQPYAEIIIRTHDGSFMSEQKTRCEEYQQFWDIAALQISGWNDGDLIWFLEALINCADPRGSALREIMDGLTALLDENKSRQTGAIA